MSGREVGATLATGFLTLLHTMHLIASTSMRLPAWHTALHAVLATLWAATTWSVVWASKVGGLCGGGGKMEGGQMNLHLPEGSACLGAFGGVQGTSGDAHSGTQQLYQHRLLMACPAKER